MNSCNYSNWFLQINDINKEQNKKYEYVTQIFGFLSQLNDNVNDNDKIYKYILNIYNKELIKYAWITNFNEILNIDVFLKIFPKIFQVTTISVLDLYQYFFISIKIYFTF